MWSNVRPSAFDSKLSSVICAATVTSCPTLTFVWLTATHVSPLSVLSFMYVYPPASIVSRILPDRFPAGAAAGACVGMPGIEGIAVASPIGGWSGGRAVSVVAVPACCCAGVVVDAASLCDPVFAHAETASAIVHTVINVFSVTVFISIPLWRPVSSGWRGAAGSRSPWSMLRTIITLMRDGGLMPSGESVSPGRVAKGKIHRKPKVNQNQNADSEPGGAENLRSNSWF